MAYQHKYGKIMLNTTFGFPKVVKYCIDTVTISISTCILLFIKRPMQDM